MLTETSAELQQLAAGYRNLCILYHRANYLRTSKTFASTLYNLWVGNDFHPPNLSA